MMQIFFRRMGRNVWRRRCNKLYSSYWLRSHALLPEKLWVSLPLLPARMGGTNGKGTSILHLNTQRGGTGSGANGSKSFIYPVMLLFYEIYYGKQVKPNGFSWNERRRGMAEVLPARMQPPLTAVVNNIQYAPTQVFLTKGQGNNIFCKGRKI